MFAIGVIGGICSAFGALFLAACAADAGHTRNGVVAAGLIGLVAWPFILLYMAGKGAIAAPKFLYSGFLELKNEYVPAKPKLPEARIVR